MQEIGRAGRDGEISQCLLLYRREDIEAKQRPLNRDDPAQHKAYNDLYKVQTVPYSITSPIKLHYSDSRSCAGATVVSATVSVQALHSSAAHGVQKRSYGMRNCL
jgi:superfamily II DNA helicase RecQ